MTYKAMLVVLVACLVSPAALAEVTFDFNSLTMWQRDDAIGAYMTDTYGSAVSTSDALTGLALDFSETCFIGTLAFSSWDGNFDIVFEDEPISGASFTGFVFYPSGNPDFEFKAYDGDDQLVYSFTRNNCFEVFESGWMDFGSSPVSRLHFSNSGIHAVGIDDLTVSKAESVIPAPGAFLLVALGLGSVAVVRRSRRSS